MVKLITIIILSTSFNSLAQGTDPSNPVTVQKQDEKTPYHFIQTQSELSDGQRNYVAIDGKNYHRYKCTMTYCSMHANQLTRERESKCGGFGKTTYIPKR